MSTASSKANGKYSSSAIPIHAYASTTNAAISNHYEGSCDESVPMAVSPAQGGNVPANYHQPPLPQQPWISGRPQQSSANASSASSERYAWCRLSSHATICRGRGASVSAGSAGRNESVYSDGSIVANYKCTEEMMMPA